MSGPVSGVVISATTGTPIPRALVQWNDLAVLTDHDGKFVFDEGSSSGQAVLQITKPGFYGSPDGEGVATVSLQASQMPATVRLFPEALITGTLTSADGIPLPRVVVMAQRSTYSDGIHQWSPAGQNPTNSRGEFRIALPPGDYRLETSFQPRFAGTAKTVIPSTYPPLTSSDTLGNVLHLTAGTEERIALHPEVAATYPVPLKIEQTGDRRNFPRILAHSSTGATIPVNFIRSESGPASRIELPLGTYSLTAFLNLGDTSEYGETSVTVSGQNTPEAVLRMVSVPAIPVEVSVDQGSATTSDKVPVPQQLGLTLNAMQQTGLFGNSSTGVLQSRDRSYFRPSPGTYRLVSRGAGPWFIKSATYGTTDLLQNDLTVAPGAGSSPIMLTVSNQTGSLQGATSIHGVPVPAWIYLIPTGPSANSIYSVRSSTTGTFNFAYLPAGSYQAVGFELRHQENYRDPNVLSKYAIFVKSVTITAGNKATIDLDAITAEEMLP